MRAQMQALGEGRYDDLVDLLDQESGDPPPEPGDDRERAEYRQIVADGEALTKRLAQIRAEVLAEIRTVERKQGREVPRESRSRRGNALDGYV